MMFIIEMIGLCAGALLTVILMVFAAGLIIFSDKSIGKDRTNGKR